jgi:hypothetical protein
VTDCACAVCACLSPRYATDLTPVIGSVGPGVGYGGQKLWIGASYANDVTIVKFMQNGTVIGLGTEVSGGYGVTCTVPDLRPGVYKLLLQKADGEMSVDPDGRGVFTAWASITDLDDNVGSLAGGLPLALTVGGAGLSLNNSEVAVTIAGIPCPILNVTNRYHLTCRAPAINGYVYAEYWNLGYSTYSMPDIISFTNPGEWTGVGSCGGKRATRGGGWATGMDARIRLGNWCNSIVQMPVPSNLGDYRFCG